MERAGLVHLELQSTTDMSQLRQISTVMELVVALAIR